MSEKRLFLLVIVAVLVGFLAPRHALSASTRLLIAIGQEPTTMDPSACWVGSGDYQVSENYAEYLIYKVPTGDLRPGLATSWKMSPDGKEIEFTLRKGVKFHSGDPLTARDVQFSFERGRAINSTTRTRLASMERFEVIDDYRFKVHFKAPDVTFIPNRGGGAMIVSKSYYDRVGQENFAKQPVGTGPYKFVAYVPGEYADIERFENYWGEKPSIKEARFYFVPEDTTRAAKLKAGEVDFISSCPYPLVKDFEKSQNFKVVKYAVEHPALSVAFSPQNPKVPWHDKRVRLAMAYAIDWKSIVNDVLMGIPNHWTFLAPYELGYDPDLKPYSYDPKKAKELLAQAGFPNGFEFKLYFPMTGRVPMNREVSEAIASYLEAVGIRTKLMAEEYVAYRKRYAAAKSPEAEFVSIHTHSRAGSSDPTYCLELFYTKTGGFSIYTNPEFEKVVAEAKATVDSAKRAELIKKAVRILHEEVPTIPIYNNVAVYAMRKSVDFTPTVKINQDLILVKDIRMRD